MASFKNLISNTSAQISSGGTITGDLVINGDLQVDGGGSLSFDEIIEGTQVIDVNSTEAFLVRKDSDGGDVFVVDTTNEQVKVGDNFIVNASGTTPVLTITGTRNDILFTESDTSNLNTLVRQQTGLFRIDTINDALDTITRRFTIDHSNGNIGINKDSPEEKLHVSGNVRLFESGNSADKTYSSTGAGLFLTSYQSDSGSPYTKTSDIVAGSDGTVPSELRFFTRTSGSANLTNALTIDSSQRVGIGVSSPEANLSFEPALVTASTEGIKFQNASDTNDAIIQPWRFASGMGMVLGSNFFLNTSGAVARFKDADESVGVLLDPRGTLDVYTGASGVDATSKLRIDNDGGATFAGSINTTLSSTGVIGDLRNTNASGYGLKIQATGGTASQYIATFNDKDDNVKARVYGDGRITSFNSSGAVIRLESTNTNITGAELVGKLEAYISDPSGNLPGVAGSIDWTTSGSIDGGSTKGTNLTFKNYLESAGLQTVLTIDKDKTATFSGKIKADSSTSSDIITFSSSSDSTDNVVIKNFASGNFRWSQLDINHRDGSSVDTTPFSYAPRNADIKIDSVTGHDLILLESGGNVIIGSPTVTSFATNIKASSDVLSLEADGTGGPQLRMTDTSSSSNDDTFGLIDFSGKDAGGNQLVLNRILNKITDNNASSTDSELSIYAMSNDTLTETVRIGSGILYLPQGQLQFPDTQNPSSDSHTLDDYEEGTWTPILSDGTNNFTMASNQNGRYTKIGRVVHFEAECGTSSVGSASGNLKLIGLPFTSASSTSEGSCSIGFLRAFNYSADTIQLMAQVNGNTTEIGFTASKDDTTEESVQCSQADSSSFFIRISGTYFV